VIDVPRSPALELSGVQLSYAHPSGPRRVLDGVDLRVEAGEVVAVSGPSGSGKTTLLTLVAGFEPPDGGTIRLGAGPAPEASSWGEVAVLPQSLGMLDELTVLENISLPLRLVDRSPEVGPHELMDRLGIDHLAGRFPSEISLGEQQRAALARAVVIGPSLLLADEPISHQNQAWALVMVGLIAELASSGMACLLATHNEVAFSVAHRVLQLRDGRLVTDA
jgi:putative ABC transport system ATP-binding protein